MNLLPPDQTLRSIVDFPLAVLPDEIKRALGLAAWLSDGSARPDRYRDLQARLYLYGKIDRAFSEDMPEAVRNEISKNEIYCLIVLLHLYHQDRANELSWNAVSEILQSDMSLLDAAAKGFLANQTAQLLLDDLPGRGKAPTAEQLGELLTGEQTRLLALARIVTEFDPTTIPSTINQLRNLTSDSDAVAAAAFLLLSRIYRDLQLPYEEKDCLSNWRRALTAVCNSSIGSYAAGLSGTNRAMATTILDATRRHVELLKASDSSADIQDIVNDFSKFGFGSSFSDALDRGERADGCDLHVLSRNDTRDERTLPKLIADTLLHSEKTSACIVLRDETPANPEVFPVTTAGAAEDMILAHLLEQLSDAAIGVYGAVVSENILERRKWIICYDLSKPIEALCIGIYSTGTECSVIFAKGIFFETALDSMKEAKWFSETIKTLSGPFDAQKHAKIAGVVRNILSQASAGYSSVRVQEV